jgi:lactate dehydrogenase-like 2-hydroxyacid dehydrogenase
VIKAVGGDGIIINISRGSVIDEDAMIAALKSGALGGAGLDVFADEPRVDPALLAAPHAVLLPHLGSATVETREAMGMRAATNVDLFFAGEPVRDRVA